VNLIKNTSRRKYMTCYKIKSAKEGIVVDIQRGYITLLTQDLEFVLLEWTGKEVIVGGRVAL
jgi:hypothetical protein